MLSFFRMDMYRLLRSTSFWVCLVVACVIVITGVFSLWFMTTPGFQDALSASMNQAGNSGMFVDVDAEDAAMAASLGEGMSNMDYLQFVGNLVVSGGLLATIVAIFVAIFIASEFETGYSKNVFSVRKSRFSFFASKALTLLVVVLAFFIATMVTASLGLLLSGLQPQAVPIGDVLLWSALAILVMWALSMLVSLMAWVFRSKAAGLIVGIVVGAGLVFSLISLLLSLIPSLSFLDQYMLFASLRGLGGGLSGLDAGDVGRIAGVGVAYLVLYSGLSMVALKKKDI